MLDIEGNFEFSDPLKNGSDEDMEEEEEEEEQEVEENWVQRPWLNRAWPCSWVAKLANKHLWQGINFC